MLTPGLINSSVIFLIHSSLFMLSITFTLLYFLSSSIHCIVLLGISLALWASITWFLAQLLDHDHDLLESNRKSSLEDCYISDPDAALVAKKKEE